MMKKAYHKNLSAINRRVGRSRSAAKHLETVLGSRGYCAFLRLISYESERLLDF